jgi:SAM-dependent methyltransferase
VSKRDDDSQADMEVGMTTAERRRRRRRGGLRVPSDNVPRRASTPPVVAPAPEDPALAISIAYSFTAESSEPVARTPRDGTPSFENHEVMPTVIDPVSGPIEQADFEMKTREMTAVDLEELGLSELAPGGFSLGRTTLRDMEPLSISPADGAVGTNPREALDPALDPIDPEDDVEVDLDASMDGVVDAGALEPDPGDSFSRRMAELDDDIEIDSAEPTSIHHGPPAPPPEPVTRAEASQPRSVPVVPAMPVAPVVPAVSEASGPRPVAAISHEPSGPRQMPGVISGEISPPRPAASEASGPRQALGQAAGQVASQVMSPMASQASGPTASQTVSVPPVTGPSGGIRIGRAQTVALSEDDLEEVREAARLATQPAVSPLHPPSHPAPAALSALSSVSSGPPSYPSLPRPASTSIPPPMPPAKPTKPRTTAPMSVPSVPPAPPISTSAPPIPTTAPPIPTSAPPIPTSAPPIPTTAPPIPSSAPPAPVIPSVEVRPVELRPAEDRTAEAPTEFEVDVDGIVDARSAPVEVKPAELPRDSQPMGILRDGAHSQPPPMPKAPPSPPPAAKKDRPTPASVTPLARPTESRDRELRELRGQEAKPDGKPRGKPWFIDLFDEDYLRTLPFLTPQATQAEAEFVINALGLSPGAQVLDVGCGYGRHAMELAARGFHIVGLDLSTPLLVRGGEEAHRRGLTINFVRGDVRELDFDAQFDGAYCLFSTFGYFDDETNKKTVANMARALRPGGRLLIEILNRDYVIADLPTRVWWEGDGCVVLEEVELNYFSSRIQVNRSVVFDDGRQLEQEISVRAYSLHEVGKLLHSAGLRVLEVSGAYHTRGRFFGNQSRHIIVLAERKDPSAG